MALPIRLTPATAPSSQVPRDPAPSPAEVEGRSSGRTLRPLQDVVREVRVPDRGPTLPWPELVPKLPARFG